MSEVKSIVEYFYEDDGDRVGNRCGYCHSSNTGFSQGMWAHKLSCQDYQDLIDRGWRRSGKYVYKPAMKKTCCPLYTIRCDALNFQPSKSHKKVMKKVAKYLTDKPADNPEDGAGELSATSESSSKQSIESKSVQPKKPEAAMVAGPDPTKPPCQKAKLMRKERKRLKLQSKGVETTERNKPKEVGAKNLEELLYSHSPTEHSTHKLEVKLVKANMKNEEFTSTILESHAVFAKYQMSIHHDTPSECSFNQFEKNTLSPSTGWGSFHEQFYLDDKLIAVGVLDILPHCVSSVYFYYDTDYSNLSLGVYSALRELQLTRELSKTASQLQYYYMGFYVHSCPKMKYKANYRPSYLACPETYSWIPIEKCLPKLDVSKYARLDDTDKEDPVVDINTALVLVPRFGLITYSFSELCVSYLLNKFIFVDRERCLMAFKFTAKGRSSSASLQYRTMRGSRDDDKVREFTQLVGSKVTPRMALYIK